MVRERICRTVVTKLSKVRRQGAGPESKVPVTAVCMFGWDRAGSGEQRRRAIRKDLLEQRPPRTVTLRRRQSERRRRMKKQKDGKAFGKGRDVKLNGNKQPEVASAAGHAIRGLIGGAMTPVPAAGSKRLGWARTQAANGSLGSLRDGRVLLLA
jgi:hypothetical protein